MKPSESWQTPEYYTGDDAETTAEIAEKKPDVDIQAVRKYAKLMVKMGKWKAVMVRRPGKRNPETAYVVL